MPETDIASPAMRTEWVRIGLPRYLAGILFDALVPGLTDPDQNRRLVACQVMMQLIPHII
jgi:hypothetical protein